MGLKRRPGPGFVRAINYTAPSAATSISITGLNGLVNKEIWFYISAISAAAANVINMTVNGDTGNNYTQQRILASGTSITTAATATGAAIAVFGQSIAINAQGYFEGTIFNADSLDSKPQGFTRGGSETGTTRFFVDMWFRCNTDAPINSIELQSNQNNGIAAGTRIEIWLPS